MGPKEFRALRGARSRVEWADMLCVSVSTIKSIEQGRRAITVELAIRAWIASGNPLDLGDGTVLQQGDLKALLEILRR